MGITRLALFCVFIFNFTLCLYHTLIHTHTQAADDSQISNKPISDACDSFWFSPLCNNNHRGLDPVWAWAYSQMHRASHSVSMSIFTRMFEESRQSASVTVTHRIAHELRKLVDDPWLTSQTKTAQSRGEDGFLVEDTCWVCNLWWIQYWFVLYSMERLY